MTERSRASRFANYLSPELMKHFPVEAGAWYETPDQVKAGLRWGKDKERRLKWVRAQMEQILTRRERECIVLYYFCGMTYREVGIATGTHASSACRAVKRGIRKLRAAAVSGADQTDGAATP